MLPEAQAAVFKALVAVHEQRIGPKKLHRGYANLNQIVKQFRDQPGEWTRSAIRPHLRQLVAQGLLHYHHPVWSLTRQGFALAQQKHPDLFGPVS